MKQQRLLESSQWLDLVSYKPWEIVKELALPLPWLFIAFFASTHQGYLLTLIASAYFFLACLRVSHNAFHYSLGLSRPITNFLMLIMSILMMTSMRATQYTHMLHHKHCLGEEDVEGSIAKLPFYEMLLNAPLFSIKLHMEALKNAKHNQRFWVKIELLLNVAWILLVWLAIDYDALKIHTILMMLFHLISPFFTVWSVHHNCEGSAHNSRTLRNPIMSLLAFNMLYHLEHHYYPAVPTCHLPELTRRLDSAGFNHYKMVI